MILSAIVCLLEQYKIILVIIWSTYNSQLSCWLEMVNIFRICCKFLCRVSFERLIMSFYDQRFQFQSLLVLCLWEIIAFSSFLKSDILLSTNFQFEFGFSTFFNIPRAAIWIYNYQVSFGNLAIRWQLFFYPSILWI